MKRIGLFIIGLSLMLAAGCVRLYETPLLPLEPNIENPKQVTLGLRGFGLTTREIVGSSIGVSSASVSGSTYNYNSGVTTFSGTGSATSSALNFGDKTSEAIFIFTRNELESQGFFLQANNPDYVLEGQLGGPYTKFGCLNFWLEAPFVLGTLFTYYSLPSEGWCELRVYDSQGHFVKSYYAEELRLYRQVGIPYFSVFNEEAMSPFARRRVVCSAVNKCLNQFFDDLNNEVLPITPKPTSPPEKQIDKHLDTNEYTEFVISASGFFITKNGYLLTNYHVVDGAEKILIKHNGESLPAHLVAYDKFTDLALLKTEGSFDFLEISDSLSELGEDVFTTGYPNPEVQGSEIKYTEGNISSTSGVQDDSRLYQISVPIQPGNSGGPLVTKDGKVTGMIVSKLSDFFALKTSGSLPQNVNYAIKSTYMKAFLFGVNDLNLQPNESNDETAIQKAKSATAMILAYHIE